MDFKMHASEQQTSSAWNFNQTSIFNMENTFRQHVLINFTPCDKSDSDDANDVDASLKKGWKWNGMSKLKLICVFRSLLTTLMPMPRKLTAREWNKWMKIYNGNKWKKTAKKEPPPFNVISQNIPGTHSIESVGVYIGKLLRRYQPAILFLCEVSPRFVSAHCPPDYDFVEGTLQGRDWVRVSALIKVNCDYEIKKLNVQVPTLAIEMQGWLFVGCYREWTWGGDPETRQRRDLEVVRLKTLLKWWRGKKGKCLLLGDMNFDPDPNPTTSQQKGLWRVRELIHGDILMRGWNQLVTDITWSWPGKKSSCIDHIYTNAENFVEHVFREQITGTDHYAIGVKVRLKTPVFVSSSFLHRSIDKVKKDHFEGVFCNMRVHEVYNSTEVDESLGHLCHKILTSLNIVAPEKKVITSEKHARWMTPEILLKIKERNQLRKVAERTKESEDWREFKTYQKTLMKEMRKAREENFKAEMDVKNSKLRWARLKSHAKLDKRKENDIVLDVDGED